MSAEATGTSRAESTGDTAFLADTALEANNETTTVATAAIQAGAEQIVTLRYAPQSAEYPLACAKLVLFAGPGAAR